MKKFKLKDGPSRNVKIALKFNQNRGKKREINPICIEMIKIPEFM